MMLPISGPDFLCYSLGCLIFAAATWLFLNIGFTIGLYLKGDLNNEYSNTIHVKVDQ